MLLTQEMRVALDAAGVDAALDRYRMLREEYEHAGAYDFREWEVNTLAEDLQEAGRDEDAIAVYELNREYFPESVAIAMRLGQLYENVDDTAAAIASYERVLAANPDHEGAKARLEALKN
jgi:tetratricopeptide (TPR) repeat protein